MSTFKKKSLLIWIGVNKDKSISMHTEEPTRDNERGIWVSKSPFINSILHNEVVEMIGKTDMSWEADAQPFQLNI